MNEQNTQSPQVPQQPNISPATPANSHTPTIILVGLIMLMAGFGGGYLLFANKSTQISPQKSQTTTLTPTIKTDITPTSNMVELKKFTSDSQFFKFSLMAPSDSIANFPPTAGIGGLYLKSNAHPYGLVIEYTSLTDESARNGAYKKEYDMSTASDIKFDGRDAVKLSGKDVETVYQTSGGPGTVNEFNYTKYLFRDGANLYIVSIQTDKNMTNYQQLKNIAQTWKFEN